MLAKLTDATTNAAVWAQAQAGPLVQEKIAFGRAQSTAAIGLSVIFMLAAIVLLIRASRREWMDTGSGFAHLIIGAVSGMVGVIVCSVWTEEFLLVWFAPRLYIVEWLKSMVTK